ncbi:MAG: AsmA family protein, partial [Prevotellaceae bacterium]|nr:AsmA family protein [Prevotellaceae bacterium]
LNDIKLNLDGWLAMLDDGFDMDLKLSAPTVQFKSILSLIPAIYAKEFESIKADGKVSLDGFAKGTYNEKQMPAFDVKLLVNDAWFQYPDLPKRVENININAQATNPDGNLEHTAVSVHGFSFLIDGNPFAVTANIKGITDPAFNFTANGKFNLGTVKDFYPLDKDMTLSGLLTANMNASGLMSQVEKEQFDRLQFSGTFALSGMTLKTAELKNEVNIKNAQLTFNPKTVSLNSLNVAIGQNDIAATGSLENFIAYVLLDKTIRGTLNVNSNYLNINDFLPTETPAAAPAAPAPADTTSTALEIIVIPQNIDFTMNADFKKIIYDKIELDNSKGQMIARDGILSLKNINTHAFDGTMTMDGAYNTQDVKNPTVAMDLTMNAVSLAKLFAQVNTIQQLAPIFENMNGTFGIDLKFNSPLAADMMPVLDKLTANGTLTSNNFSVSNVKVLDALATALKNESLRTIKANDLKINFAVANGRVSTDPFNINMGNIKMNVSGSTGLDQTIDYVAKVALPSNLTANIPVTVGVKIGGTFTSPKIGLDGSSLVDTAKDLIKDKVGEQVDALKGKANEELQKLIEQATAKKDALVTAAQENGQKLRDEAAKQGDALVAKAQEEADNLAAKASNPLAKVAAQTAGKKLVDEAQKQANNLKAKANDAATKLETTAQTEGDKLIQAAQNSSSAVQ